VHIVDCYGQWIVVSISNCILTLSLISELPCRRPLWKTMVHFVSLVALFHGNSWLGRKSEGGGRRQSSHHNLPASSMTLIAWWQTRFPSSVPGILANIVIDITQGKKLLVYFWSSSLGRMTINFIKLESQLLIAFFQQILRVSYEKNEDIMRGF
jgi:hypothetical protein